MSKLLEANNVFGHGEDADLSENDLSRFRGKQSINCVYPKRPINWTMENEEPVADPPLIAIEIMSQIQTVEQMMKKANAYLNAGAGATWIVISSLQTLTIMKRNTKPETVSHGVVRDESTGVEVNLDDVFQTA